MNYYQFHIGDYAAHTRNLSLIEDLAYRRLLDAYYLSEQPFNGSHTDVAREIGMRDQINEVEYVLTRFFERDGDVWRNKRADAEIANYQANINARSRAGKASAAKRAMNTSSTHVEKPSTDVGVMVNKRSTNQEPITITSPIGDVAPPKRKKSSPHPDLECPQDVDPQVWSDWIVLRRGKKAPVTATVMSGAREEAQKAGLTLEQFLRIWCVRGSQGLQADWLRTDDFARVRAGPKDGTAYTRHMDQRASELAPGISRNQDIVEDRNAKFITTS